MIKNHTHNDISLNISNDHKDSGKNVKKINSKQKIKN